MNPQSKLIVMMAVVVSIGSLGTGCDHQPRASIGNAAIRTDAAAPAARNAAARLILDSIPDSMADGGRWTFRGADDSPTADEFSSGPSIVRESVDERCFSSPHVENTEVVACPQVMQLAIIAE